MARRRGPQPEHRKSSPLRSITAAGRRLDLRKRTDANRAARPSRPNQERAWGLYDKVGEVKLAVNYRANALGRIRYFAGVQLRPDEDPVPIHEATPAALEGRDDLSDVERDRLPMVSTQLADAAVAAMDRLQDPQGGQGAIFGDLGRILTVSGEGAIVARDVDGEEVFGVYSESQIEEDKSKGDQAATDGGESVPSLQLRLTPPGDGDSSSSGETIALTPDDLVLWIWQRHARWSGMPDSNLMAVLEEGDELLLWARALRSTARTRNSNGILLLPEELDLDEEDAPPAAEGDEDPLDPTADLSEELTKFERDLILSMTTPVDDEGSASAVVPHIIRGLAEHLKEVRHLQLNRPIDQLVLGRIDHLLRRIAQGVDVPAEIVLGLADVNHWTAWQIEDSAYRAHVEPPAIMLSNAVADTYLRPACAALAFSPEEVRRVVIGRDPSALVVRPNRAEDAKAGHEALVISDEALRDALGFTETDAPSEEELARRTEQLRARAPQQATAAAGDDPGASGATATPDTETDGADDGEDAITAAGGPQVDRLGSELAAIDRRLLDRLTLAANDAAQNALRVAGSRLRSQAQGTDFAAMLRGVESPEVGRRLGPAAVETWAVSDEDLLEGALITIEERWRLWTAAASATVAARLAAIDPARADVADDYQAAAEEDRDRGWAVLAVGLSTALGALIFEEPSVPATGEFDPSFTIQPGLIRDALATAGGADYTAVPDGEIPDGPAGGLATGPRSLSAFVTVGLAVNGYRWGVGEPDRPFDPHQNLAGVEFSTWDDDRLANTEGWPEEERYFPGDHAGCQCYAEPVMIAEAEEAAA